MSLRLYDEEVQDSVDLLFDSGINDDLEAMLNTLPEGICNGCTKCCSESVNTSYVEFLRIYDYLEERPELFDEVIPKIFEFYFLEPVRRGKCPLLAENGRCKIYSVRPLPCRIFGFLSKEDYEKNLSDIIHNNESISKDFEKNYGITIPSEVLSFSIDYCQDFKSQVKLSIDERNEYIEKLIEMDSQFLKSDLLDQRLINQSICSWFMLLYYDMKDLSEARVQICKEYIKNGESELLNQIINSLNNG